MSHKIIIISPPGGNRMAESGGEAAGSIEWSPDHAMSPRQERRRVERAEAKLNEAVAILSAPIAGDEDA